MEGGTTFHFVTDGFDAAYARRGRGRRRPRGPDRRRSVDDPSGPAAGVLDEIVLRHRAGALGGGERLLDGVADPGLTPVEVFGSPRATHIRYRVG